MENGENVDFREKPDEREGRPIITLNKDWK